MTVVVAIIARRHGRRGRQKTDQPWCAREAGMAGASDEEIAATDFILSILPPDNAC